MRGGFDKDDVLAPLFGPFVTWHNKEYGTTLTYENIFAFDFEHVLGVDRAEAIKRFDEFNRTGFTEARKPFPEALRIIAVLVAHGHELHVISAGNPAHHDVRHAWLRHHFTDQFTGHHLVGYDNSAARKATIAKELELDYFVDDNPENCRHVAATGIRTYMFSRPWNTTATPPDVTRIATWDELLQHLLEQK